MLTGSRENRQIVNAAYASQQARKTDYENARKALDEFLDRREDLSMKNLSHNPDYIKLARAMSQAQYESMQADRAYYEALELFQ